MKDKGVLTFAVTEWVCPKCLGAWSQGVLSVYPFKVCPDCLNKHFKEIGIPELEMRIKSVKDD